LIEVNNGERNLHRIESLYLHIPFCTWVCKYCDFNTYAVLQGLIPQYVDALCQEIGSAAARYPVGPLKTVFFGGGTPSLLAQSQIEQIMATVCESCGLENQAEVTLEANPSNVTPAAVEGWQRAGINRLSLGVQALNEPALRFLERLHSGEEALQAVRTAKAAGLANLSCDLLYGVPGVATREWMETIEAVLAEAPDHLSAYELTVEQNTRLGQEVRRGEVMMPDPETQLEQYWSAAERLSRAGFEHYEISNWARPGRQCRHNLTYWECRPYLGCGAGAHSLFRHADGSSLRFWNLKGPRTYIDRVNEAGEAVEGKETLSPERAEGEAAMIGVRILQGTAAAENFSEERQFLARAGLLLEERGRVRLTPRGVELANQVGAVFLR
jgi:oxygen-independent coproporphyrinogen-3 oxidase